jgi:hypothetical protein
MHFQPEGDEVGEADALIYWLDPDKETFVAE